MRKSVAFAMVAIAGASLGLGGLVLANVWWGSGDSPDSTYIEGAAAFGAIALPCLVFGLWLMRGR
jgi:hypothetical protein